MNENRRVQQRDGYCAWHIDIPDTGTVPLFDVPGLRQTHCAHGLRQYDFTVLFGGIVDRLHHLGRDDDRVDVRGEFFTRVYAAHERVYFVLEVVAAVKHGRVIDE